MSDQFFKSIVLYNEDTGKFDSQLSKQDIGRIADSPDMRIRATKTVTTADSDETVYSGAFLVKSILISNPGTASATVTIKDGTDEIIKVSVGAGSLVAITDLYLPITSSLVVNSTATGIIVTAGGVK